MVKVELVSLEQVERAIVLLRGHRVMLDAEMPETIRLDGRPGPIRQGTNIKYLPHAFTEQGVAMLSSVLRSPRAVQVNIEIMRTFVQLRRMLQGNAELARKLEELEARHDAQFSVVFDAIRQLMTPQESSRKRIGFEQSRKT